MLRSSGRLFNKSLVCLSKIYSNANIVRCLTTQNKVTLVGTVWSDPYHTATKEKMVPVVSFQIGLNGGKRTDGTNGLQWFTIKGFGAVNSQNSLNLRKGSVVSVEGQLRTDNYIDKQTQQAKKTIYILADSISEVEANAPKYQESGQGGQAYHSDLGLGGKF